MKNQQMNSTYENLLCPLMLFRFFLRKLYKDVKISNEECDELRILFAKYLFDLNLTDVQKKHILPISELDVMLNSEHPLRIHGFPPAYVYHFTEFIHKMKEENPIE